MPTPRSLRTRRSPRAGGVFSPVSSSGALAKVALSNCLLDHVVQPRPEDHQIVGLEGREVDVEGQVLRVLAEGDVDHVRPEQELLGVGHDLDARVVAGALAQRECGLQAGEAAAGDDDVLGAVIAGHVAPPVGMGGSALGRSGIPRRGSSGCAERITFPRLDGSPSRLS